MDGQVPFQTCYRRGYRLDLQLCIWWSRPAMLPVIFCRRSLLAAVTL